MFKKFSWVIIFSSIALTLLICITGCFTRQLVLIDKGKANSIIVIPQKATEREEAVAKDLQRILKKMSNCDLPIISETGSLKGNLIQIGQTQDAQRLLNLKEMDDGSFKIKVSRESLMLSGKNDDGTEFAVYAFLEKYLNTRWFWPGETGEVVPKRQTISVGHINDYEKPDFIWRDRGPGGALWGATEGPTEMHDRARLMGITKKHQDEVKLWEKRNKWGGIKIYGGHILSEIFPPEEYAKTHPEYYALVNGKRTPPDDNYDYKHGAQICTTNPEVLKIAVEFARNFFDKHPDYDGLNMSMNDGGPGFCECESCRALDIGKLNTQPDIAVQEAREINSKNTVITDRIFTFYNQVTEDLQKTHPGKHIICLAYSRYSDTPVEVEIHPYLIPQYCLWSAYKHSNPEIKQKHQEIVESWSSLADEMGIYEYYINGSWPGMYRLIVPFLSESIKKLHEQGVRLYQTQSGDEFAINGLNYYVAGKLLWDASLDTEEILNDFYQKAFGKSADDMRNFHQRLSKAWAEATREGDDISSHYRNNTQLFNYLSPQLIKACSDDLENAIKSADNEFVLERINFFKKGLYFTKLNLDALKATDELEKSLENLGITLFPLKRALIEIENAENKEEAKKLIKEALYVWEKRDSYIEEHKNDFIFAYFWVKYNDIQRGVNPSEMLKRFR